MAHRWRSWAVVAFVAALPGCKRNSTAGKPAPAPPPGTATDAAGAGAAPTDGAPTATRDPTPAAAPGDDVVIATDANAEVRATIGGPRLMHPEMIKQVAIASDGTPVSASASAVRTWRPDGGLRWQSFVPGVSSVFAVHGDRIAAVHSSSVGGRLTVFDRDGKPGASVETNSRAWDVAWSPDGTRVVVAGAPIVVYDAATGSRVDSVKVTIATAVAYAGDRVVYVAKDGIYRWQPGGGAAAEPVLPLTATPKAVAFSADGATVYISDGATVSAVTIATGATAPIAATVPGPITELASSPDNHALAVSWKGGIRVFTLGATPAQRWERVEKLAASPVIAFSADGKTAVVSDIGQVVRVDAATGAEVPAPAGSSTYDGFSATSQLLVEAADKTTAAYDLATGAKTAAADAAPTGAPANMDSWTYDATGKALAWDSAESVECAPIKVWRTGAASAKTLAKPKGCADAVSPWQLGPRLVVGLGTETATIWDPDTGKPVMTLPESTRPLQAVATSASGALVVAVYGPAEHPDTGFDEGTLIDLYDLATTKLVHETRVDRGAPEHGDAIVVAALLDDGTAYLGCEDGAVLAAERDSDVAREVARLGAFINVADAAPDGKVAALADNDLRAIIVGPRR